MALSELTRKEPHKNVLQWLAAHAAEETFIGAPSIGELQIGITLLDRSTKRRALERWFEKLVTDFGDRILPFDVAAARVWGRAVGEARERGNVLPATDSQIAAIACVRGLAVVTRNVRHFRTDGFEGLTLVNPWHD